MIPTIACMGEVLIDFISTRRNDACSLGEFSCHLGGAPASVAVNFSRLGGKSTLIGCVGDDQFGDYITTSLETFGVDISCVRASRVFRTSLAVILPVIDAEPDFIFYRNPGADHQIVLEERDLAAILQSQILHIGTFGFSREPLRAAQMEALGFANRHGIGVSVDLNLRPSAWDDITSMKAVCHEVIQNSAIVKMSRAELQVITGSSEPESSIRLVQNDSAVILVTLGGEGCFFATTRCSGYVAGFSVPLRDVVGAGDGFQAGYLFSYCSARQKDRFSEASIRSFCRRANAIGAHIAAHVGAHPQELSQKIVDSYVRRKGGAVNFSVQSKLLLFDIDGTLLDSRLLGRKATEVAASEVIGQCITSEGLQFDGLTDGQNFLQIARRAGLSEEEGLKCLPAFCRCYVETLEKNKSEFFPLALAGVKSFLEYLSEREDFVVSLLTGSIASAAELKLRAARLWKFFRFGVYGSDSLSRYDLPGLAQKRAQEQLGIFFDSSSMVVIGDTVHDVGCARQFGARSIAVATGSSPEPILKEAGADVVLASFEKTSEAIDALSYVFSGH